MAVVRNEPSAWTGWIYFAGTLMLVVGGIHIIEGLAAIFHRNFYAVTEQGLVAFNYTTWGWISLFVGLLIALAGAGVWAGATWARVVGVTMAVLALLENFAFLSAYPLWSIIGIILSGFVIFALTMHGSEVKD